MLENIVIEPASSIKPLYAIIWLHGLGADGHDFVPLAKEFQQLIDKPVRFIFPHAPLRPITLNNGYVMRAWYDITGLHLEAREDQKGLEKAAESIDHLIQHQIQSGIVTENIFLGGFSQGAGAILYTGLRYPQKLGGLIALSGYVPLGKNLASEKHPANQDIPIFWGHGIQDNIVPVQWAEISGDYLQACGFENRQFHTYPMAHEVCRQEIEDIGKWFKELS